MKIVYNPALSAYVAGLANGPDQLTCASGRAALKLPIGLIIPHQVKIIIRKFLKTGKLRYFFKISKYIQVQSDVFASSLMVLRTRLTAISGQTGQPVEWNVKNRIFREVLSLNPKKLRIISP